MQSSVNKRTDEYGGDIPNRCRFTLEVCCTSLTPSVLYAGACSLHPATYQGCSVLVFHVYQESAVLSTRCFCTCQRPEPTASDITEEHGRQ